MTDSEKLDLILSGLQELKKQTTDIEQRTTDIEQRTANIEQRTANIENKVNKTDLIIENEIRVNIQRVAEGHLDLSRKLNECIKLSSDIKDKQELQDIYINMHNSKLKAL